MLPPEYDNTDGAVTIDCVDVSGANGIYYAVMQYIGIHDDDFYKMFGGDTVSEEDSMTYYNSLVPMFSVVASAKNHSTKEIVDSLREDGIN